MLAGRIETAIDTRLSLTAGKGTAAAEKCHTRQIMRLCGPAIYTHVRTDQRRRACGPCGGRVCLRLFVHFVLIYHMNTIQYLCIVTYCKHNSTMLYFKQEKNRG